MKCLVVSGNKLEVIEWLLNYGRTIEGTVHNVWRLVENCQIIRVVRSRNMR